MNRVRKVAAIHDLSGIGRCSLTVAIPVISAMGIQVCPLPTAVLSSQTDGYDNFSFTDFTANMPNFISNWKELDLNFDCIYSGFLGSPNQIELVSDFIDSFSNKNTIVVVDPVMGDNRKLYSMYDEDMKSKMLELVKKSDVITPNLTEACFLLQRPYPDEYLSEEETEEILISLSDMGPRKVVVTSIESESHQMLNAAYEQDKGMEITRYDIIQDDGYPGSGDMFASIISGGLVQGLSFFESVANATNFLTEVIHYTYDLHTPIREGLVFEPLIENIISLPKKRKEKKT